MPGSLSHYVFFLEVERRFAPPFSDPGSGRALAILGSQGPDPFYFTGTLLPSRRTSLHKVFADYAHDSAPGSYFPDLLRVALATDAEPGFRDLVFGFLLHFVLDRRLHPFVYALSGFDESGRLSGKWQINHTAFETQADHLFASDLLQRHSYRELVNELLPPARKLPAVSAALVAAVPPQFRGIRYAQAVGDMRRAMSLLWEPGPLIRALLRRDFAALPRAAARPPVSTPPPAMLNPDREIWRLPATGEARSHSWADLVELALEDVAHILTWFDPGGGDRSWEDPQWWAGQPFEQRNHEGLAPGQRNTFFEAGDLWPADSSA